MEYSATNKQAAIIVTGGSNGIGAAIIDCLAGEGREVLNFDIAPPQDKQPAHYYRVDLTNHSQIDEVFCELEKAFSVVGLVNNAGFSLSHSLEETTHEDFEELVPLNVIGPTLLAKNAARLMKKSGWGRIVNISSRAALGKANRSAYAATKGAITSLTRVWALELASHNITVNTVGPGPIATDLFLKVNPEGSDQAKALIDSIPVRRVGSVDDIGEAVKFFLNEKNSFITGQTLYVCGGLTIGTAET